MTLYEEIKKNFILPNAYADWKDYRNSLTSYIIRETNQVNVPLSFCANMDEKAFFPSLAIIGAGACNDIDLQALLPHFSKITLLDYDKEAMNTALETYHLENCPYIECSTISVNGLNDSCYEEFCNQLQTYVRYNLAHLTPNEFEDYAITLIQAYLNRITNYKIPLPENTYDYICCFGVHSQFQAMFSYIYHAFEVNLRKMRFADVPDFSTHFNKHLQEENERFIPLFHDTLLRCAKQSVFLGLERKRTNDDGAIEGAYQAISDIQNRKFIAKSCSMVWPFLPAENLYYEMVFFKLCPHIPVPDSQKID